MQNSVISTWITSLYWSQTSYVVFACKIASFGSDLQVSMGTRPHLLFCAYKTAWLAPELLVSLGSSRHRWFCAFKTATLGPKLHVPMGPTPHLWFTACKTASLVSELQLSMSPSLMWGFCKQNRDFWTRITNLYGSKISPVVLCMQYSVISTRITFFYGSQPLSVAFGCKTATFGSE